MSTTIGSLLTIMARHLQEQDSTFPSGLWTQAEAIEDLALQDQDFLCATGVVKNVASVVSGLGSGVYSEPTDSADVERVSFNGRKVYPQTSFELDRQDPNWRAATGRNPRRYHRDGLAEKQFQVWPTPTSTASNWTVTGNLGIVRSVGGTQTYTINGQYGIVRRWVGSSNVFVGSRYIASNRPYVGTMRSIASSSNAFMVMYDVLSPLQTTPPDLLVTPDAFARYVMYGALARLWEKEGDGQDLDRAAYCWQRYARGVWLAKRLVYGDELPEESGGKKR